MADEKRGSESRLPAESKQAEVEAFLRQVAAMPAVQPASGRGRLIFALDATAGREPTWDHACRLQGEMFEATASLGGLDVQLVFYRGFGEGRDEVAVIEALEETQTPLVVLMTDYTFDPEDEGYFPILKDYLRRHYLQTEYFAPFRLLERMAP